jgi:outer membrane lipoprotein-sorting protein
MSWILVGLLLTASSGKSANELVASGTAEQKGQAIALELSGRNAGYEDLGGQVEMVLRDADGAEARRGFSLKVLERRGATDGDRSLIVFDNPADVKGTAVLSHAGVDGEDEQWLFLPSAHRTKRISSSNRTGSFAGSEFSFEDLTGNDGRKYSWKYLGTEACEKSECLSVETVPKDPSSAYSRRVLHLETEELRVVSIDFFDRKGAKLKTLSYGDYQKLNDRFWRSQLWTMKNFQSGKSTTIRFVAMKLQNGFTANDFSTGKLGN